MNREKCLDLFAAIVSFLVFAVIVIFVLTSCNTELKRENERLREELARQQQYVVLQRDTIRDTVEVITQKVYEVERIKEVLTEADRQLIKDLKMKVSELESLQKIGTATHDTVYLTKKDSSDNAPLYYKDAWAEFEYQDNRLRYSVRDSLAIALRKEYKHRFLWIKWGVKGYDVKVANFNPHGTIKYNTFVRHK